MSEKSISERVVANFLVPPDPNRDYVHWRNFLRQWFVLGPFSFADREYAKSEPARALDEAFLDDEADLVPHEDEEAAGRTWRRYSAVAVMSKWWELAPERVLLKQHHGLRMRSTDPVLEPPGGVHVTIDHFTVDDELMPCWTSELEGAPREPYCPRCETAIPERPQRCRACGQRIGSYTSYSSWGFPRRAWARPSYPYDYSVTYLAALVHAQEGGDYALRWSSTTPCRIWVNGADAARFDGPFLFLGTSGTRKWDLFSDPVHLRAGWNHVVAKTVLSTSHDGEHCFSARLEKPDRSRVSVHSTRGERVAPERRLHVSVSEPIYIGVSDFAPALMRCSDGTLLVSDYISRDDGATWTKSGPKHLASIAGVAVNLPGGPDLVVSTTGTASGEGVATCEAYRSADGWRTVEDIELTFHLGAHVPSMGEDGVVRINTLHRGAVVMPDGSMVGMCYGFCDHDLVYTDIMSDGWDKYPHAFKIYKYSSWCLRSEDGGMTWRYAGCVPPLPEMGDEGWAEPGLTLLPNGELLTILRNGEGNAPLYLSRSADGGRTWSDPVRSRLNGQWPGLLTMSNGMIVAIYGRPDNRIAVCLDGHGEGWPYEIIVSTALGWQGVSAVEIGPDELLVVFEDLLWRPERDDMRSQPYRHLVAHKVRLELLR